MIWSCLGKAADRLMCVVLLAAFAVYLYTSCLITLECRPLPVPCSCEELPWWQVCTEASAELQHGSSYCGAQAEIRRLIWEKVEEIDRQIKIIGSAKLLPPFPMPPLPTLEMPDPFGTLRDSMGGFDVVPRATWSCSVTGAAGAAISGGIKAIGGGIKAIGGGLSKAGKGIAKAGKGIANALGF